MTTVACDHILKCSVDEYWSSFLDDALNQRLFCRELGFPEYRVSDRQDEAQAIRRRLQITPKLDLPASVAKVIGDRFSYCEAGALDLAARVYRFELLPPDGVAADKASCSGSMRAEATANGETRRIVEVKVHIRIFGLGTMLERFAAKCIQDGYDAHARALNAYFAAART